RRNIDFNQYSILFRPVRPYRPSLFPYTTLFRSRCQSNEALDRAVRAADWTVSVPINVHERGTAISGGARPPPRTVAGTKPRRRGLPMFRYETWRYRTEQCTRTPTGVHDVCASGRIPSLRGCGRLRYIRDRARPAFDLRSPRHGRRRLRRGVLVAAVRTHLVGERARAVVVS